MSPNPITDQWTVSVGIRRRHKIWPAHRLDRFLINLGQDRTNSVIWLPSTLYLNIYFQNFPIPTQNSKFNHDKNKENWARYHNYYGMTCVLEDACKDSLKWSAEMIRDYTVNHAHEVNHQMAVKFAHDPPPLPQNNDDAWFKSHPKLPGSGKAPCKKITSRQLRKKKTTSGSGKRLPRNQQSQPQKKPHRYRPSTVAL